MLNRWAELETFPWERQENEPPKAYNAFVVYRDMGPLRSLAKSADIFYAGRDSQQLSQMRQLGKWSTPYRWVARCTEFDAFNDFQRWTARETDIRAMENRHAQMGVSLQRVALERLESLPASALHARDVVQFLKEGVTIERLARGEATDRTELGGTAGRPVELAAVSASQQVRDKLEHMMQNRNEVAELTSAIDADDEVE